MLTLESSIYEVRDADALRRLAHDVATVRRRFRRIRLGPQGLPADESRAWEKRLNSHLQSRGSGLGVVGYLAAISAYAVYMVAIGAFPPDRDALTVGIPIVVGGAVLGKLLGLLRANLRLRRTALLLEAILRALGERGWSEEGRSLDTGELPRVA